MALSAFDDKSHSPRDRELAETLGRSGGLWKELRAHVSSRYEPVTEHWGFSGQKAGWALRLKRKQRTVLYMIPCRRYFIVAFVLGEKAVRAAHQSDLPKALLDAIDSARQYVEGRGVRVEVRNKKDLRIVVKLAAIKMAS
jgi:hypothetical protein